MSLFSRSQRQKPAPLSFDGYTCPVREHTADGAPVGRCDHSVYGGYCPRHGLLAPYLRADGTGDDRDFPDPGFRVWPELTEHRQQLGVREQYINRK
jgi:hypothetical protein